MPDVFLYSVPTDGANDVRLRDPTTIAAAITGTLAAVETQDVAAFSGSLVYSGALAAVEAQDTATFAGALVYSGTLAATEAQDSASFAGELPSTALHGRRIRGRRVVYRDELPAVIEAPKQDSWPEELPSLEPVLKGLEQAKEALAEAVRVKAKRDKVKALETALGAAQARYDEARGREDAIIQRLRDEDELWLLAA